jgi:hypothetical protein
MLAMDQVEINLPAVYRDGGTLLLAFAMKPRNKEVLYVSRNSPAIQKEKLQLFQNSHVPCPEISPYELSLNYLCCASVRGMDLSARAIRRCLSMSQKEQLEQMSERALAREYSRFYPESAITRVSADRREAVIDKILAAVKSAPPISSVAQSAEDAEEQLSNMETPTMAAKKQKTETTSKAPKKQALPKAPRKAESSTQRIEPNAKGANPYREGSKKRDAYAAFLKGGERSEIIEKIEATGATKATANSWYQLFRKFSEAGNK